MNFWKKKYTTAALANTITTEVNSRRFRYIKNPLEENSSLSH
jgi:hypothetical protein